MITILTALRGNHALTSRLLASSRASGVAVKVLATVNNDEDDALVRESGGKTIPVSLYSGDDEVRRVNHIASLYDQLLRLADTDYVILWDDDVLPPYKGLKRLAGAMLKQPDTTAGVVTVYPYSHPDLQDQAVLFWKPFEYGGASIGSIPAGGLHKVWAGGTGFSMWRRKVLLRTIPWTTSFMDGSVPGSDRDLAIKLEKLKLDTFVESSIRCRHDLLPE